MGRWLSQVLKESPFEVAVTGISDNGEETLKALLDTRPDILITDINMPLIDGLDVLKRLEKAGERLPKTIVISGYDEFDYARRAIELEVMAYLLKPLERRRSTKPWRRLSRRWKRSRRERNRPGTVSRQGWKTS